MKSEETASMSIWSWPGSPRLRLFLVAAFSLSVAFALPLVQLVRHVLDKEIHSHILLIPFVSIYLWRLRKKDTAVPLRSSFPGAALAALIGTVALAAYLVWGHTGQISRNDTLALSTFSFLCFLLSLTLGILGWPFLRAHLFAACFLIFMIPLPGAITEALSVGLQMASAEAANLTLRMTGMPVYREGLLFQLPGLSIVVAEECSGIRSTLVLFITSLIASYLFLRTGWRRSVLALAVFPLGVFRNAFRITVISWLTVNVDPGIIHGPLHHRGGPVFFVLSLVPFFALLWFLRRSEARQKNSQEQ